MRGRVPAAERRERVRAALELVGLDPAIASRRPSEISGGQRQRVSLARAVILEPRLLICDEPVSALDASNRNYILRILGELRDRLEPGMMVISHDLGSLAGVADRVAVLYRGRIVEEGPIGDVFSAPQHPYTALLIASAPHLGARGPVVRPRGIADPAGARPTRCRRAARSRPAAASPPRSASPTSPSRGSSSSGTRSSATTPRAGSPRLARNRPFTYQRGAP